MDIDSDVVVIGAGIVGLAVAREITRRHSEVSVSVLEKESRIAMHQSGHNSGVVHGGIYYRPGSLKAQLCVEGARLMYEYCDEHSVPYKRCGKLIVASTPRDLGALEELHRRGLANHVLGLRRVTAGEIEEIEPNARGIGALHAPGTGIVDYKRVCSALADDLQHHGVNIVFDAEVTGFSREGTRTVVQHDKGRGRARRVIVCGGLWSDRLARKVGAPAAPRIVPFRGAYLLLRDTTQPIVHGLVYPVPTRRCRSWACTSHGTSMAASVSDQQRCWFPLGMDIGFPGYVLVTPGRA